MPKWRRFVLLVTGCLLLVGISASSVFAQQRGPGSGLTMSPVRTELTIFPGLQDTIKFALTNVSGADATAKVEVNDFEADGETGEPKIIVDTSHRSITSIQPFLSGVSDVPLKKDEKKSVSITVTIPKGTAPGAYYGVVRYSAAPVASGQTGSDQGKVALTASVGHLVLLEVPGNITKQIQLLSLQAFRGDSASPIFFRAPNQVGVRIKNIGNGFAKPIGRVTIDNNFNGKEVYAYEINSKNPKGNILPNSIRLFKDDIKNVTQAGRYTMTAAVAYDSGGEVLILKKSFWYVPVWLAIAIVGVLLIVAAVTYLLYRRYLQHPKKTKP